MENNDNDQISYEKLLSVIVSGCKFLYFSYDHKKAMEEYNTSSEFEKIRRYIPRPKSWDMPDNLKEKYKIERIGKLREIHFSPRGKAWRFKIGAKYAKSFGIDDFGVKVFPIL